MRRHLSPGPFPWQRSSSHDERKGGREHHTDPDRTCSPVVRVRHFTVISPTKEVGVCTNAIRTTARKKRNRRPERRSTHQTPKTRPFLFSKFSVRQKCSTCTGDLCPYGNDKPALFFRDVFSVINFPWASRIRTCLRRRRASNLYQYAVVPCWADRRPR